MENLFNFFITLATISAFLVINNRNPVHSVLFLILVFFNTSGILLLVGIDFFAMIFLVVYVGAIAVLFLFVVMMLNIKLTEMNEKKLRYLPLGVLVGFLFLFQMLTFIEKETIPGLVHELPMDSWFEGSGALLNIETLGHMIYTHNCLHFLLASFLLFVAMVGAIVLTMEKTIHMKRQEPFYQNAREFTKTIQRIEASPLVQK